MEVSFSHKTISHAIMIQNEGLHITREGKLNKLEARNKFVFRVLKSKDLEKFHIRVVRESIPKLWDDIASMLIKYVMLDMRYKILLI